MGLKEKKAARDFEQDRLDSLKAQIFEAAKFEFEIEIKWDTITIDGYSHLYEQTWPLIYFEPVIIALKEWSLRMMVISTTPANVLRTAMVY